MSDLLGLGAYGKHVPVTHTRSAPLLIQPLPLSRRGQDSAVLPSYSCRNLYFPSPSKLTSRAMTIISQQCFTRAKVLAHGGNRKLSIQQRFFLSKKKQIKRKGTKKEPYPIPRCVVPEKALPQIPVQRPRPSVPLRCGRLPGPLGRGHLRRAPCDVSFL